MKKLKVCFIGVGSIARRHIRNLHTVCAERSIELTIDAVRRKLEPVEGVNCVFSNEYGLPDDYDVIFITNPTDQHLHALKAFHNRGRHFFIEKPAVSLAQVEEAKRFPLRDHTVYYVACPLRYHAVIQYIKENTDPADVISVRSICSSYLPDWRPGQDYREVYSAHKELGGGVSIDLIHEWDYLVYLFGMPDTMKSIISKKSNLEIDSDDIAIYLGEYEGKTVELHLDYFGRKPIREMMLLTKKDTIVCDLIDNKVHYLLSGKEIVFQEERDDYQKRELNSFLDMIDGIIDCRHGFLQGIEILELTQQ